MGDFEGLYLHQSQRRLESVAMYLRSEALEAAYVDGLGLLVDALDAGGISGIRTKRQSSLPLIVWECSAEGAPRNSTALEGRFEDNVRMALVCFSFSGFTR